MDSGKQPAPLLQQASLLVFFKAPLLPLEYRAAKLRFGSQPSLWEAEYPRPGTKGEKVRAQVQGTDKSKSPS